MTDITIKIDGMTCVHCVMRVKRALDNLIGVKESTVEIGLAKVSFDESVTRKEVIEKAITEAGYRVVIS